MVYLGNKVPEKLFSRRYGKAQLRRLPISVTKVRPILDQIRGLDYESAVHLLSRLPYRASKPILKVVKSAYFNALHSDPGSHPQFFSMQYQEKQYQKKSFVQHKTKIIEAYADKGYTLKRFRPRAQGRGFPIQKPTCHIKIVVEKSYY